MQVRSCQENTLPVVHCFSTHVRSDVLHSKPSNTLAQGVGNVCWLPFLQFVHFSVQILQIR